MVLPLPQGWPGADRPGRLTPSTADIAKSVAEVSQTATRSCSGIAKASPSWKGAEPECGLDDRSSCPRTSPAQLAPDEVSTISVIEAWWRSLRHQWLYLHMLDSLGSVKRVTAFYIEQRNTVMPHSAFLGQTPDEIYFGTGRSRSCRTQDCTPGGPAKTPHGEPSSTVQPV